jgi:hypothetical protein
VAAQSPESQVDTPSIMSKRTERGAIIRAPHGVAVVTDVGEIVALDESK